MIKDLSRKRAMGPLNIEESTVYYNYLREMHCVWHLFIRMPILHNQHCCKIRNVIHGHD